MTSMPTRKLKIDRLRGARRPSVDLSQVDLVKTGHLAEPASIPWLVEPAIDDVDLAEWAAAERARIDSELRRWGAVLFRGFGIDSVPKFEAVARGLCDELYGDYGDLPSEEEGEKVYHSTPYPADKTILFHNESSHLDRWPTKQWFYCVQAAREGGETPIADCREIYRRLDPELRETFERQGLVYVRNFIPGLDVSWQDFFKTDDRGRVEERCRAAGIEIDWTGDGLRTRKWAPAVTRHPVTGDKAFFNQVELHHPYFLDPEVRESMASVFSADRLPRNVLFGDGSPIPEDVMAEVAGLYWEVSVSFPWRAGDVLMVDNMLTAHARKPFVGPRKIVVAMGDLIGQAELGNGGAEARDA